MEAVARRSADGAETEAAAQRGDVSAQPRTCRRAVIRRRWRQGIYAFATLITALMGVLVLAAFRDDAKISSDMGVADAEVLDAGRLRSVIWFSANGEFTNPPLGVLYPTNLATGARVRVEYYRPEPNLVRIQGRGARLAIVPALSVAAVIWAVALPLIWLSGGLRRKRY